MTQILLSEIAKYGILDIDEATALPTFFHQDLALLWALSVPDINTLPPHWQWRVGAWKKLLSWWLVREVEELVEPATAPFSEFIPSIPGAEQRRAFSSVTWLLRNQAGSLPKPVGIVSPIVIVRPEPNAKPGDVAVWGSDADEPWRRPECAALLQDLRGFLYATQEQVNKEHRQRVEEHCTKLLEILDRHFPAGAVVAPALLQKENVALTLVEPYTFDATLLSLNRKGVGLHAVAAQHVPLCASCKRPLLPAEQTIREDQETVVLPCPSCGGSNVLPLAHFRCGWFNHEDGRRLAVWTDESFQWAGGSNHEIAPVPRLEGNRLIFEYPGVDPRLAQLPAAHRNLVLNVDSVAGADAIVPLSRSAVLYQRPLWPGKAGEGFARGVYVLPLRPEYRDLLERRTDAVGFAITVREAPVLTFEISLHGLPGPVKLVLGEARTVPGAGLAIFPRPDRVPVGWKWFRSATHHDFHLRTNGADRPLPSIVDSDTGAPDVYALISATDPTLEGCTVLVERPQRTAGGTETLHLGVDFGTTNSVIYLRSDRHGQDGPTPFKPADLRSTAVEWVITPADTENQERILDGILPKPPFEGSAADTAIIPSELCSHNLINWGEVPCCGSADIRHLFKNDPARRDVQRLYLKELVVHALAGHFCGQSATVGTYSFSPVFTYPLTLNDTQLGQFTNMAHGVVDELSPTLGAVLPTVTFMDESTAGKLSIGRPQATRIVVAADLGGGTMDICVGRGVRGAEFIGAVDAGGRHLITSLSQNNPQRAFELQRGIRSHSSGNVFQKQDARERVARYYAFLLTYLETVILAYLKHDGEDPAEERKVLLYLLGNGWRFVELTAAGNASPREIFEREFEGHWIERLNGTLRKLGYEKTNVELQRPDREPKHVVAYGALLSSTGEAEAARLALPAGIRMHQEKPEPVGIEWHEPFGPGARASHQITDHVAFDFSELGQRLSSSLIFNQTTLDADFSASEDQLRRLLFDPANDAGGGGAVVLFKGPLQLLLESTWIKERLRPDSVRGTRQQ